MPTRDELLRIIFGESKIKDSTEDRTVIRIYPMRHSCSAAGRCMRAELDCDLIPIRLGWCREKKSPKTPVRVHS